MSDKETAKYLNVWKEQKVAYNRRDLLTYAVGIGCTDLNFVYENDADFAAFPTYPIVLAFKGTDQDVVSFPSPAMFEVMGIQPMFDGVKVQLDGERMLEQLAPIDPNGGEYTLKTRVIGVHSRGSGVSVESEALLVDAKGTTVTRMVSGGFYVGPKGYKDSGITNSEAVQPPAREPDAVVEMPTDKYLAQVYRLSGDYNPLHVDPNFAQMSGFQEPILHGLCSYGITCRAVLKQFGNNDPKKFKSIKARFASPVLPGQTLVVEMWKEAGRIIVLTKVKETGKVVINNAYVVLAPSPKL